MWESKKGNPETHAEAETTVCVRCDVHMGQAVVLGERDSEQIQNRF